MKRIGYFVPYFGRLPEGFALWLTGCAANPTIDWLLYTDDRRPFRYPPNVKVSYCSYEAFLERLKAHFDFPIEVRTPWHLSLFKPAYGEIFARELSGYDFWGHCDVDLLWGNIRKFLTDGVLDAYDRIGFQGHSLLYRNKPDVNARYRTQAEGLVSYRDVFSGRTRYSFDEDGMDAIYRHLKLPYYHEVTFAHLRKYAYGFSLGHVPREEEYKNQRQIFEWNAGTLLRHFLAENRLCTEECMYIHFFCRPMSFREREHGIQARYVIYPDAVRDLCAPVTAAMVRRLGRGSAVRYYAKSIWKNRHRITAERVLFNVRGMLRYRSRRRRAVHPGGEG